MHCWEDIQDRHSTLSPNVELPTNALEGRVVEGEYKVLKGMETFCFMGFVNSVHPLQFANPR